MNMSDDLMNLEETLMRKLTAEEVKMIANDGMEYFIREKLNMDGAEFNALNTIRKIISAYCTESQSEFDKVLEAYDITIPYYALKTIVNEMESKMKEKQASNEKEEEPKAKENLTWGTCPSEEKEEDLSIQKQAEDLCNVLNKLPKCADNWLRYYVQYVKDHSKIIELLKTDVEDSDTENQLVGDILDTIKDSVIDACIEKLKVTGEIELDPEVISEVTSKLWHTENNIRINIVNNKLKVEFK